VPDAKILMLTTFDEDELVLEAVRVGARGYLLKDLSGSDLASAPQRHLVEPLSGRERAVPGLLARGHSNKEIAEKLFLTEGTVKNHVSTILAKIDARDGTQAALKARELGLLDGPAH
jgi:DNA-binding NarL/FixJ family response regulator